MLKSETMFARLRLTFMVHPNHTTLENQNTHYWLWFPYSKLCEFLTAVLLLFLYLYFRHCVRTWKSRVDEEWMGYQQSKSRRKTCHHSALKINETGGKGKAKYGESTAAKKGTKEIEQEGGHGNTHIRIPTFRRDRWHNSLESQTQLSFHLAQEFTAKHHLFIKLLREHSWVK